MPFELVAVAVMLPATGIIEQQCYYKMKQAVVSNDYFTAQTTRVHRTQAFGGKLCNKLIDTYWWLDSIKFTQIIR